MMRAGGAVAAWPRWMRRTALVMAAVVTVTTLGACVPGETARSESTGEVRLYEGPIPEPAPLTPSGLAVVAPPPTPTEYTDEALAEYQARMQEYLDSLQNASGDVATFMEEVTELAAATAHSDEASVAAWQSLLVAAGIAVGVGPDAVNVNGMEGAGPPMSHGELRLLAMLGASSAEMPLTQVADMLGGTGAFDEATLAQVLYDDLMNSLGTDFGIVFSALNPDAIWGTRFGIPSALPLDEVSLSAAQTSLLLRRIALDVLVVIDENVGIDAALADSASVSEPLVVDTAGWRADAVANPCGGEEGSWRGDVRGNLSKAAGALFGKLVEWSHLSERMKFNIALVQAMFTVASLIARMAFMKADMSMSNSPLVRTKNREPGERREVDITLTYPPTTTDDARRCLSAIFAAAGFELSDHANGPATGVDVNLVIRSDRLWLSTERGGTATYLQKTNDSGVATFPVLGKPQRERLPEGAEPDEVVAPVRFEANVQGSDLVKDVQAAAWDVISPNAVAIIANVISRMKLMVYSWQVPVRDWELTADFDVRLSGTLWGHYGVNRSGVSESPCGPWDTHRSTSAQGSVESQDPVRVTAHYVTEQVEGDPVSGLVMYTKGSSLGEIQITSDGGELAHLPVGYSVTKSESEPGQDPMPPHFAEPGIGGCGLGTGEGIDNSNDCGPRDYAGIATIMVNEGSIRMLADRPLDERPWDNCGSGFLFADPLAPPTTMANCQNPQLSGGEVPSADSVFNKSGRFEISGTLNCSRDSEGSLNRFTFDWTLTFCRVNEEGKSSGC